MPSFILTNLFPFYYFILKIPSLSLLWKGCLGFSSCESYLKGLWWSGSPISHIMGNVWKQTSSSWEVRAPVLNISPKPIPPPIHHHQQALSIWNCWNSPYQRKICIYGKVASKSLKWIPVCAKNTWYRQIQMKSFLRVKHWLKRGLRD